MNAKPKSVTGITNFKLKSVSQDTTIRSVRLHSPSSVFLLFPYSFWGLATSLEVHYEMKIKRFHFEIILLLILSSNHIKLLLDKVFKMT